jgi:rhamnulose-1-phosphate aldolase
MEEFLEAIAQAGLRLAEMEASEGAAGNISLSIEGPLNPYQVFAQKEEVELPIEAPELVGSYVLATGSGCRLREIERDPVAQLGLLQIISPQRAFLYTHPRRRFRRLTSELNSHLAIHRERPRGLAVIHAQPLHLTYLSHIPAYRDASALNARLLRWQPETIVHLPEGLGVLPFLLPGSQELQEATVRLLRSHRAVLWSKHGILAVGQIAEAVDLVEYLETAARYEYLDLTAGQRAEGLSPEELRRIAERFGL